MTHHLLSSDQLLAGIIGLELGFVLLWDWLLRVVCREILRDRS